MTIGVIVVADPFKKGSDGRGYMWSTERSARRVLETSKSGAQIVGASSAYDCWDN